MMFSKRKDKTIEKLDTLFDTIDKAQLLFKEGVKNYLYGETLQLEDNISTMSGIRTDSENLRHEIENDLYKQPAFLRLRGDVMRLLERIDGIIIKIDNNLSQFDIERPFIPTELNPEFTKLTELCTRAIECAIPAAKSYFRNPDLTAEKNHRVYFYAQDASHIHKSAVW